MRVLQIHNQYRHLGGEDAVVSNEMKLLASRGMEVGQLLFKNDKIHPRTLFFNKESYQRTRSEIKSFRPDIVHVHNLFYNASPSVLKAAKDEGLPVVMTLHNYRLLCTGALFLRKGKVCSKCRDLTFPVHGIRHKCFQGSLPKSLALSSMIGYTKWKGVWTNGVDRFIALTPFIKELLESSSLRPEPGQVVVKPNSTDDLALTEDPAPKRKGYLFVGRLSAEKGADILIQAFKDMPQIPLTVIGDGPLESELRRSASPNIRFMGRQSRSVIQQELNRTKALVFPSVWYEGLPNTIIESFSAGTPVIATDMDNINTLVSHQHNGLLFEKDHPGSLVEKVHELERDPSNRLGKNARETYREKYTHQGNYEALKRIYEELLQL